MEINLSTLNAVNVASWNAVVEMNGLCVSDYRKETKRIPCTWQDVKTIVQKMASANFPEELTSALLHPDGLVWHFINLPSQNFLPLVFAGFSSENARGGINKALSVIQLVRKQHDRTDKVYLSEIRSAGVMTASNGQLKAVGITHNAHNGRVTDITVSTKFKHDPHSFNPSDTYIAGPITQAMADAAGHNHYVNFFDLEPEGYSRPEFGYYFNKDRPNYHEVGVDPNRQPLSYIEPIHWHIMIPNTLAV